MSGRGAAALTLTRVGRGRVRSRVVAAPGAVRPGRILTGRTSRRSASAAYCGRGSSGTGGRAAVAGALVCATAVALRAGISTFDLSRYMGASLTMIDRHYGHLARDGASRCPTAISSAYAVWAAVGF
jgi:hypothetical protein